MEAVRKFPGHSRHFIEFIKSEILLQTILLFFRSIFDTLRLRPLLPRPASIHPGAGNRPEVEERIHRSVETGLPVLEGSSHDLLPRSLPTWEVSASPVGSWLSMSPSTTTPSSPGVSSTLSRWRDIQTYSQLIWFFVSELLLSPSLVKMSNWKWDQRWQLQRMSGWLSPSISSH